MEHIFEFSELTTQRRWLQLLVVFVFFNSTAATTGFRTSGLQFSTKSNVTVPTVIFTQISLEKCWEECTARVACRAFNYYNLYKLCELDILGNLTDVSTSQTFDQNGVVYWSKTEFPTTIPCGPAGSVNCSLGQTCDKNSGTCKIKECGPLNVSNEILVRGNVNRVGSFIRLGCKEGYVPSYTRDIVECGIDGQWTEYDITCKRCDEGWAMFYSSCYTLFHHSVSWVDAKTRCEQAKATLVLITSEEESNFTNANLLLGNRAHEIWIGTRDIADEGTSTSESGEIWLFQHFAANEPIHISSAKCHIMLYEQRGDNWWYSLGCEHGKLPHICEKPI
ncbi:aggrecan core protein-like [Mya arenaria]|uniref:aggrecan core protein-like n=1 Tax=Mya arenaria TaxID=6604 RepID=UPI0022DF52E3|nr:aggrecan core protein-like [Mya arenaria]